MFDICFNISSDKVIENSEIISTNLSNLIIGISKAEVINYLLLFLTTISMLVCVQLP